MPFSDGILQVTVSTYLNLTDSGHVLHVNFESTRRVPGIGWEDEAKRRGSPFNYFSTGAACTEIELDCLTGQHQVGTLLTRA